ncbi:hypothetical protein HHI36_015757 [Cryptolaemus montrouzieri]|uniref:Rap-GAP domain-containing protein n=1 Tax=Cryptolaemus montrouzieri TaxID=559131 RepID=A0ABD2N6X1_9CUCU
MSSRDKENKSFHDKFKQFFKRNPGIKSRGSFELTEDIQRDIGKETSIAQRIKKLKELNERILLSNLDTETISRIWVSIEDIFSIDHLELRNTAFALLKSLIKHQNEELRVMRAHFFRFIKTHNNPQDIGQRLQLLIVLTNNGKNVQHFEEEIGPFLLNWFADIQHIDKMAEFLDLILNTIKFNAVCLESLVLAGLVEFICILCCGTYDIRTVNCCLQILETVIAYSNMPADSLPRLISALCRTVNSEDFCHLSWKVGKNLLGTHMGHSALYTLCLILQEPGLKSQTLLLRGAVFFIHMSLWSTKPVASLCCPPNSVLPSFLEVVKTDHPVICYEVILGIHALVSKQGSELQHAAWASILEIIKHVNNSVENNLGQSTSVSIVTSLHETLSIIECLIERGNFNGPIELFFDIIEECAGSRPESSVLKLMNHLSKNIVPTEHFWLSNLNNLLNKYFKSDEVRTNVRLAALDVLANIVDLNRGNYEDELIERIVIPHCMNIMNDSNIIIRSAVAKTLLNLCKSCESKKCVEMLDIIEKMLFHPFEVYTDQSLTEKELSDVLSLVKGLIEVFVHKMERLPSSHAIKIYKIFVIFLETHYKKPKVFANCHQIRYLIFECFLKMRADDKYHLGCLKDDDTITYSPYLCVTSIGKERGVVSPLPQSPALAQHNAPCNITYVSIKRAFRVFITCLEHERDWNVINLVLQGLPKVMRNKPLILSRHGNIELDVLVDVLSPIIVEKRRALPDPFGSRLPRHEYINMLLMILVTLPSYHACLDQKHQQILVRCLSMCVANSFRASPKQLIEALTICCLEMRDVMVKMLPEILLTVSKISPTIFIAVPVLEFLSTLTQLPMVYASFVDDQYMAVFAITSPFTNPFKYNHYTVSLAHYVIGVWFLKCRLPIRKNFVKFITNGLQTNVLTPFEERNFLNKVDLSKLNKDSSDRKRSSSLTEHGPRRRAATVSGGSGSVVASETSGSQEKKSQLVGPKVPNPLPIQMTAANVSMLTFYKELTETCIDLMARYAFSPCSALPRRTPTAEFLMNGGQSMSWIIENKLITITTSGCSQKALKHGLCDKCWNVCSNDSQPRSARSDSSDNPEVSKLVRQNSNEKPSTSASSPVEEVKKVGEEKTEDVPTQLKTMVTPDTERYEKPVCACWCQSWAEIFVRRPTGDMSWVMRIQNTVSSKSLINEFPLKEITNLFMPTVGSLIENNANPSGSRTSSSEETVSEELNQSKDKDEQLGSIPISIPSTTPPSNEVAPTKNDQATATHPSLLSCHSYPGSSPPKDSNIPPKPYQTVPPSPSVLAATAQPFPSKTNLSKNSSSDMSVESVKSDKDASVLPKLQMVSMKPPQSPTQTSPKLWSLKDKEGNEIQKSASASVLDKNTSSAAHDKGKDRKGTGSMEKLSDLDPQRRDRTHTVSGTSPGVRRPRSEQLKQLNTRPREAPKSGINPSFVFLQIYQRTDFSDCGEKPLLIGTDEPTRRAVSVLDHIPPYETHKIGVLYIREGQANKEADILRNTFGSIRYGQFLQRLGTLIKLQDVDPQLIFLGGLSQSGEDGKFSYIWQDDLVKVIFHVATLMPNKESDVNCNAKKLHIGNNNVTIVYNESGEDYNISTIKSQFNFASVIIHPMDHNLNRVTVKCKTELLDLMGAGCQETKIVSDQSLAILARQLALHTNLASLVYRSLHLNTASPYASNWLERLRQIKKIRNRLVEGVEVSPPKDNARPNTKPRQQKQMEDFTDYS